VAFIPFDQNQIGWVPLGPGDVYVPHYYNTTWEPQYLTRDNLYQRVVNLNVPGAVTVVSVDDFTRGIDWKRARKADRNMLASVNPVLDPLLLTPLRNAVVHSAWGRGKIDIPPGIAKKLNDTTVVTSTTPKAPSFRPDIAKTMRVNNAPERAKGQKFQVRDERKGRGGQKAAQAPAPVQQPQQQQQQQQRIERAPAPQAERAARPVKQEQPRGERVATPSRPAPAQQQQQQKQKQERANPGKGKGKKP
jgi:hypothetical protein